MRLRWTLILFTALTCNLIASLGEPLESIEKRIPKSHSLLFRNESSAVLQLQDFLLEIGESKVYQHLPIDLTGRFKTRSPKGTPAGTLKGVQYQKDSVSVAVIYENNKSVFEAYRKKGGVFDSDYIQGIVEHNFESAGGVSLSKSKPILNKAEVAVWVQENVKVAICKKNKALFVCSKSFLENYQRKIIEVQNSRKAKADPPLFEIAPGSGKMTSSAAGFAKFSDAGSPHEQFRPSKSTLNVLSKFYSNLSEGEIKSLNEEAFFSYGNEASPEKSEGR